MEKIHEILVQGDKVLVKNLSNDESYRSIFQGVNTLARTAPLMIEIIENEEKRDNMRDSDSD